ncbi:MAG: molybdopterin-guanine dinucleotide biosynthesis protein B, partial [Cetobacterium sp.]
EDYKSFLENKNTKFFAVSGVKNSGKTTLITKLLERFSLAGYKVGTIKHDGHDFEMDNIGSDTHKHIEAGARGTLIFSKNKFMFLENSNEKDLDFYLDFFKGYDFIILEGFKNSNYPKLEIIRSEISTESVSNKNNLKFLVSDLKTIQNNCELEVLDINNIDKIFETTLKSLLSYS